MTVYQTILIDSFQGNSFQEIEYSSIGICLIFFLMMTLRSLILERRTTEVKAYLITLISRVLKEKPIFSAYNTSDIKCLGFSTPNNSKWVSDNLIHSDITTWSY